MNIQMQAALLRTRDNEGLDKASVRKGPADCFYFHNGCRNKTTIFVCTGEKLTRKSRQHGRSRNSRVRCTVIHFRPLPELR